VSGGAAGGSMSVLSSPTLHTCTTTTQPSRLRHPGAAKNRLANAKEADKRSGANNRHGWQKSMEVAAASAHRVWEREAGLRDYDDQKAAEWLQQIGRSSDEKIHIPLHVFAKQMDQNKTKRKANKQSYVAADSRTHFPVDWGEKIGFTKTAVSNTRSHSHGRSSSSPTVKHQTTRSNGRDAGSTVSWRETEEMSHLLPPSSPERRERLVEYFCSPTHRREHRNQRHHRQIDDLLVGSTRTDRRSQAVFRERRVQSVSPLRTRQLQGSADFSLAVPKESDLSEDPLAAPAKMSKGWVETMRAAAKKEGLRWDPLYGFTNLDAKSVSDVISIASASQTTQTSPTGWQGGIFNQLKQQRNHQLNIGERTGPKNDPPGRKNLGASQPTYDVYWPDQTGKHNHETVGHVHQEEKRGDDGETVSNGDGEDDQSTAQEQIEVVVAASDPTGTRNYGISALNFEENEDYMLQLPPVVTPNVAVKKERVDHCDRELFPASAGARARDISSSAEKVLIKATSARRRKCDGPVDVDDVEGSSKISSTDGTGESNVWESAVNDNDSFLQGSITSRIDRQNENKPPPGDLGTALPPETHMVHKRPVSWSAHAKRLAQNVRGSTQDSGGSNAGREIYPTTGSPRKLNQVPAEPVAKEGSFHYSMLRNAMENASNNLHRGEFSTGVIANQISPDVVTSRADKVQALPNDVPVDDASTGNTTSSVTAGWKSFLNKKVQAESVAAARWEAQIQEGESKAQDLTGRNLQKTVSFASDSLLSDSTLFDFSKESSSPVRTVGSPRRRLSPNSTNREQSLYNVIPRESFEGKSLPPIGLRDRTTTGLSTLTSNEEQVTFEVGEPSFFKRFAECQPRLPSDGNKKDSGGGSSMPVAMKWYLQSKQASERVEEMLGHLRSSCTSRAMSLNHDKIILTESYPKERGCANQDSETAARAAEAQELARARVEAMLETLYYAGGGSSERNLSSL